MTMRKAGEPGAWAIAALLASLVVFSLRPQPLMNDSYQYLSVAEELRMGNGLATTLIHFNTERSHGVSPAPLTSFSPGYPLAIAALGIVIPNLELAGRWVSLLGMAATAALLAWGLIFLQVPLYARSCLLLLFITNADTLASASAVQSEFLFCAIITASVLTAICLPEFNVGFGRAAIPFLLISLGYIARYAGMLLLPPFAGYEAIRLWLRRHRMPLYFWLLPMLPFVPFLILSYRNWKLTGTWRGGNEIPTYTPLFQVAADYVRAQLHLLWGEHAVQFGLWEGLVVVGLAGLGTLVLLARPKQWGGSETERSAWILMTMCVGFYSAVMCYLGIRVTISFGTRMFQPLLPFYLLMFGLGLNWLARHTGGFTWKIFVSLLVAGSIGTNARDWSMPPMVELHSRMAEFYAEPLPSGQSLREWVESTIPPSEVILAADGQATGYLLKRATVSLLEAHYTTVHWDCDTVLANMGQFRARYVFLYQPHVNPSLPLAEESEFIRASLAGNPPCGFRIAAQTDDITVVEKP